MAEAKSAKKAAGGSPRSAARLAAVQAHYQLMMSDHPDVNTVEREFVHHRRGQIIDEDEYVAFDAELFSDVLTGSWKRFWEFDAALEKLLPQEWPLKRLHANIHAILRLAGYEFAARPDVPTKVIINEYLDVTHAFFERAEVSFVNGILDSMARSIRG